MAGSSNWIIIYDKTSHQVTRRVWDDAKELTLAHPAAGLGPNETAFLWPTASFQASALAAAVGGYAVEQDPTLATAILQNVAANALG